MQQHAIHKTRRVLLTMSDRQLEDVGISRDLLAQGASAWPWRADTVISDDQPKRMSATEINKAIRELSDMTDKELLDLGVTRGSIRHAVTNGTQGKAA